MEAEAHVAQRALRAVAPRQEPLATAYTLDRATQPDNARGCRSPAEEKPQRSRPQEAASQRVKEEPLSHAARAQQLGRSRQVVKIRLQVRDLVGA